MIVAEYLGADAVVVPISCNDAIDRGPLAAKLESKTRIGSPFVIAGIDAAKAKGRNLVCGWEANGGFLLGSDIIAELGCCVRYPLAMPYLPIVSTLASAREKGSRSWLFSPASQTFQPGRAAQEFPRSVSAKIIARFSPADPQTTEIDFSPES